MPPFPFLYSFSFSEQKLLDMAMFVVTSFKLFTFSRHLNSLNCFCKIPEIVPFVSITYQYGAKLICILNMYEWVESNIHILKISISSQVKFLGEFCICYASGFQVRKAGGQ